MKLLFLLKWQKLGSVLDNFNGKKNLIVLPTFQRSRCSTSLVLLRVIIIGQCKVPVDWPGLSFSHII